MLLTECWWENVVLIFLANGTNIDAVIILLLLLLYTLLLLQCYWHFYQKHKIKENISKDRRRGWIDEAGSTSNWLIGI